MNTENFLIQEVPLWRVQPSRWQPRHHFDGDELLTLAQSIQANGLINPVLVFPVNEDSEMHYELVAGERRTRAMLAIALSEANGNDEKSLTIYARRLSVCGINGLSEGERVAIRNKNVQIRASVDVYPDEEKLHHLAVIENLDRTDLSPIEEANAYKSLMDAYNYSQRDLAKKLGKSQGYIAQRLSLLNLPEDVQAAVNTQVISITQARSLVTVPEIAQSTTARWMGMMSQGDNALPARRLEGHIRQLSEFLNPERYEPETDRVYRPEERNKLRLLRHIVQRGLNNETIMDKYVAGLLRLTTSEPNYLAMPVKRLISEYHTLRRVLSVIDINLEDNTYSRAGMSCQSCIFGNLNIETNRGIPFHCKKRMSYYDENLISCENYIAEDDPVVIPIPEYGLSLRQAAEKHIYQDNMSPFWHIKSLQKYLEIYNEASNEQEVTQKRNSDHYHKAYIEHIRKYWEWQVELVKRWFRTGEEFQSHLCEKCKHYEPMLLEQELPPCRFALNPLLCDKSHERYSRPDFGALVRKDGVIAPRCQFFRYRQLPVIFSEANTIKFPSTDQYLLWLYAMLQSSHSHNRHGQWGIFSWLDYGQPTDSHVTDWPKLSNYIKENWNNIGQDGLARLLDVAASEATTATCKPSVLVNLNRGKSTWFSIEFPFDNYINYGFYSSSWPGGYPKPWKENV